MGFLFFTKKKKEKTFIILDIGSGSVGGAIVKIPMNGEGVPIIVKSFRSEIKTRKEFDLNVFMSDMVDSVSQVVNFLHNQKIEAPDEIVCVVASPWYFSETREIKLFKDRSFVFTQNLVDELIQKEILHLVESYKNKYGDLESAPEIIEKHIMSVFLNGYETPDPFGKRCKSLEVNMFISLIPKLCLNKIKDILLNVYPHTPVRFSSFTMDTFLAVRDKYISPDSYLLLDISGEITDVGIVTKGVLKSVLSFPFGKKTFFKYVCTKLEIELRDAEEIFKLYSSNNLSFEFKSKVEPLFKSIANSWGEAFGQSISTLPHVLILPNTIFLTADNDIRNWFANVLETEEYIQSKVSGHKCFVKSLDGPEFLNMCSIKDGTCDPFIMIESIALMRKLKE